MAKPETPTMPLPFSEINATESMEEMPLIGAPLPVVSRVMSVPGAAGLNVFLILSGMFFASTGCTDGGYSTFAPKCDSSKASIYDSWSKTMVLRTLRGSAVIMPSTSVQISSSLACNAAATIEAV